jgi:hypothetical protein
MSTLILEIDPMSEVDIRVAIRSLTALLPEPQLFPKDPGEVTLLGIEPEDEITVTRPEKKTFTPQEKKERQKIAAREWYRKRHPGAKVRVGKEGIKSDLSISPFSGFSYKKDAPIAYEYCANPHCTLGGTGKFVAGTGVHVGKYILHNQSCADEFTRENAEAIHT